MSAVSGTRLAMNIPMILTPGKVCRTWFFTAWKCSPALFTLVPTSGNPVSTVRNKSGSTAWPNQLTTSLSGMVTSFCT